jgi:ACS family glucarate transporter-like MFS transporter
MKTPSAVLGALSALSVITYLDRVCISAVGPRMQEELSISPEQWGWVMGVFLITYSALEIPSGAMGDRLGHRRVIGRIVLAWSAFTALTGAVSNFYALLLTRLLFGAGEAGAYPNMSGVVSRWFPAERRARAQGCIWACSRVGGAITPLVVLPLADKIGWRATFYAFGVVGALWATVWLVRYRDPARTTGQSSPGTHADIPWKALFSNPQLWLIMAMYSCYVWGSIFYLTWFHTYLVKGRGLSEAEMGLYASFPFILGAVGNIFGGWLSDRLVARRGPNARRLVGSVCLAASALLLCATALTRGKMSGVILLTLGFGIMDCMVPSAWAICLDVGQRYAGAVSGAMNMAGNAGGFVCSVLFGYLVKAYDSYHLPIFVIAAMVMISAFLFWRIDATRPLVAEPAPSTPPPVPCASV